MLVYTELLNCEYQGGAPGPGNSAREVLSSFVSSAAPETLLPWARSCRLLTRAGSGKPDITSAGPFRPAQIACCFVSVIHLMKASAPATFLAVTGMPMPSGLARLGAGPETPGVGMYCTWPTTLELLGTS